MIKPTLQFTGSSFKILFLLFIAIFSSCQKGKEMRTKTGMKYILYRDNKDKKPQAGDWVSLNMVYKNEKDSILYDSRRGGKPLRFALNKPPFEGSFEEGLTYLSIGDSATFFVSADSMFDKVIAKNVDPSQIKNRPKKGSIVKFDISLVNVQPYQEAEMEIAMSESRMEREEQSALEKYLEENNITSAKEPEGYYLTITSKGSGNPIGMGTEVKVKYSGHFLNGTTFDSNFSKGQPYQFHVGNNEVIHGWDIAFQKLHEGDKATIVIPSKLAYGKDGLKNANGKGHFIPPYSTLVFDVEVIKAEPLAKK